jgi:large repetitive protein
LTSTQKRELIRELLMNTSKWIVCCTLLCLSAPAHASTIFFEDFSDNSAGWTLGHTWQIGPALTSPGCCDLAPNLLNGDPGTDFTPTDDNGVAGVVIGGNHPVTQQPHDYYWLTSPFINLSGDVDGPFETVTLEFRRWLNSDYPTFITNAIQVSRGFEWYDVWVQGSPGVVIADSEWTLVQFDLTPWMGSISEIRFGYKQGSGGAYPASGWNIDDVRITGTHAAPVPEPAAIAFVGAGLLALVAIDRRMRRAAVGASTD